MMNIVDTDDVVDQMMVIVVVIVDNTDQMVEVSVHVVVDVAIVLMMNGVLLDDGLGQVVIELDSLVDGRFIVDQIAGLALTNRGASEAAHVWWWELDAREVKSTGICRLIAAVAGHLVSL